MKKYFFICLFIISNICGLFCLENKDNSRNSKDKKAAGELLRKISWDGEEWLLTSDNANDEKKLSIGNKINCEEGIFFVYDNDSKLNYLIDKNGNILSKKQFMHVGHFSNGKTIVSGYLEDKYETDRIYDIQTDSVSEPINNMWIYCGFYDGLGAFSLKTPEGVIKSVLVDCNLKNVTGIVFDEFYERNYSDGSWHFIKNGKDYFISKTGKIINK